MCLIVKYSLLVDAQEHGCLCVSGVPLDYRMPTIQSQDRMREGNLLLMLTRTGQSIAKSCTTSAHDIVPMLHK